MGSDLQHDPQDIASLLKELEEGHYVVCGWRKTHADRFFCQKEFHQFYPIF